MPTTLLLSVQNLSLSFQSGRNAVPALRNISLDIFLGETLGLVGESGCGKSTFARAILNLQKPNKGQVFFQGQNIYTLSAAKMKAARQKMQIIFQDPYASLNPRMNIEQILGEPLDIHNLYTTQQQRRDKILHLLDLVGLPHDSRLRYPHAFSGGQRQRIGIARALAVDPQFLVCDEPISALDVSIQAQIINLLKTLQKEMKLTYLFIAHDLAAVKYISDRIAVMHQGHIVELATSDELYANPLHPYTKALLAAIPTVDPILEKKRLHNTSPGELVVDSKQNASCLFATERYKAETPALIEVSPDHFVACHLHGRQQNTHKV